MVAVNRLAAADAQSFWMSAKIPNDAFLLYGFDGVPADLDQAVAAVRRHVAACPELLVRIDDSDSWRYPCWVPYDVTADWFVVHELDDTSWSRCLDAIGSLADDQLDATVRPWLLHVFTGVEGMPGATRPGTVAVVQMAHSLADGRRSAALAARMFGRNQPVPEVIPHRLGRGPCRIWRCGPAPRTDSWCGTPNRVLLPHRRIRGPRNRPTSGPSHRMRCGRWSVDVPSCPGRR